MGMKVTLIDDTANPGGVCLYVGCIPSKALLHVAKVIGEAKHAQNWGITFPQPKIDLDELRAWKTSVVERLTGGLGVLSKQRKVTYIRGRAGFVDSNTLRIEKHGGGEERLRFDNIIISTGSKPASVPGIQTGARVLDSSGALDLPDIPKSLLVIGGGYIGLELGSVYAALGTKVSVVEMTAGLLPGADRDLVLPLARTIEKNFAAVMLNTKVASLKEEKNGVRVRFEGANIKEPEQVF